MSILTERQKHEQSKYRHLAETRSDYGAGFHGKRAVPLVVGWKPRLVVDLGGGRNLFVKALRDHGVNAVGVDWAFPEADVKAPMYATGLPDAHADVVTAFDSLEHLLPEDVQPTFAEMRRIGEPGCRFVFTIAHYPSSNKVRGEGLHPTVEPPSWWVSQIQQAGGEVRTEGGLFVGRWV